MKNQKPTVPIFNEFNRDVYHHVYRTDVNPVYLNENNNTRSERRYSNHNETVALTNANECNGMCRSYTTSSTNTKCNSVINNENSPLFHPKTHTENGYDIEFTCNNESNPGRLRNFYSIFEKIRCRSTAEPKDGSSLLRRLRRKNVANINEGLMKKIDTAPTSSEFLLFSEESTEIHVTPIVHDCYDRELHLCQEEDIQQLHVELSVYATAYDSCDCVIPLDDDSTDEDFPSLVGTSSSPMRMMSGKKHDHENHILVDSHSNILDKSTKSKTKFFKDIDLSTSDTPNNTNPSTSCVVLCDCSPTNDAICTSNTCTREHFVNHGDKQRVRQKDSLSVHRLEEGDCNGEFLLPSKRDPSNLTSSTADLTDVVSTDSISYMDSSMYLNNHDDQQYQSCLFEKDSNECHNFNQDNIERLNEKFISNSNNYLHTSKTTYIVPHTHQQQQKQALQCHQQQQHHHHQQQQQQQRQMSEIVFYPPSGQNMNSSPSIIEDDDDERCRITVKMSPPNPMNRRNLQNGHCQHQQHQQHPHEQRSDQPQTRRQQLLPMQKNSFDWSLPSLSGYPSFHSESVTNSISVHPRTQDYIPPQQDIHENYDLQDTHERQVRMFHKSDNSNNRDTYSSSRTDFNAPELFQATEVFRHGHHEATNTDKRNRCNSEVMYVEIWDGFHIRVRRADETEHALQNDMMKPCLCLSCQETLYCIQDAQYVLCPDCRTITYIGDEGDIMNSSIYQQQQQDKQWDDRHSTGSDPHRMNMSSDCLRRIQNGGLGIGLTFEQLHFRQQRVSI